MALTPAMVTGIIRLKLAACGLAKHLARWLPRPTLQALPQLPLTFGNTLIAITEENNRLFPPAVLGVILFLAGAELALGSRNPGAEKEERFVVQATAAFAVLNVGVAVVFGFLARHAARRGWLRA